LTDYEKIIREAFPKVEDVSVSVTDGRVTVSCLTPVVATGTIEEMAEHGLKLDYITTPQTKVRVQFVGEEGKGA